MEKLNRDLIIKLEVDHRLSPVHLALIFGILHTGVRRISGKGLVVSRARLMGFTKIKSIATYHKSIRELVSFGYVSYQRSCDPKGCTVISFLVP